MQKATSNQHTSAGSNSADRLVEVSAKRAALEAAQYHEAELRRSESNIGAFAIYAWALFAFVASGIGGGTMYLNNLEQSDPRQQLAQSIKLSVDPITTASIKPTTELPIDTSEPTTLGVLFGGYNAISSVMVVYESAQNNSVLEMNGTEPLVRFQAEGDAYEAAVVLGPFDNLGKLLSFCSNSHLSCEPTSYTGDPLFGN